MQRPQQLAVMFLLGAFLVGGTLGFTVDRVVGDRLLARGEKGRSTVDAFSAELALSAAQRAGVDSILAERHRLIDSIMAPTRPRVMAAVERARGQIAERLDEEQRVKFRAYLVRVRHKNDSTR